MIIGTAIIAGMTGYMLGMGSSLGIFPNPFSTKPPRPRGVDYYSDEEESEDEDIDASILDHAPNWSNGLEADKRDGLRTTTNDKNASKKRSGKKSKAVKKEEEAEVKMEDVPKSENAKPGQRQEWETGTEKDGKRQDWEAKGSEECKLVFVVRTDLGMTKGTILLHIPNLLLYTSKGHELT